ncbi:MAG: hypothetical protein A2W30_05460 [Ignavibacteria bacterium RBG_16_36_9]|nr:MAG: hypothetical protein A2W30_05460 [Ignavibacteria bacterium RBG_16_36_9]
MALTSGSIWFGAYVSRLLTTYQMFEETEFALKNYITNENISAIFQTTFPLVNLTFYSYIIMIISFTLFLILSGLKLKENGWLLIVSLIIFLTLPLESLLLITDYKLIDLFMNEQFVSEHILKLIIERMSKLSSFPIILILSYLTIPYFLIFKPFTLKIKNEN